MRKRYLNYLCTNYLWSKGCERFNIRTIINSILVKFKISEESVFNQFDRRIEVNNYDLIFENLLKFLKERQFDESEVGVDYKLITKRLLFT